MDVIVIRVDAHTLMSTQALNSPHVRRGLKEILLDHSRLWESLRADAETGTGH